MAELSIRNLTKADLSCGGRLEKLRLPPRVDTTFDLADIQFKKDALASLATFAREGLVYVHLEGTLLNAEEILALQYGWDADVNSGSGITSLSVDFDFTDFAPGSILVGKVDKSVYIPSVVVDVLGAFSAGTSITVGDIVAQGRFQAASDNIPGQIGAYATRPNYAYPAATNVYAFLLGAPIAGSGRVILYL